MTEIPRDRAPDSSLALLSEGYTFISSRCRRHRTDAFRTQLAGRPVVCALGEDAARMFYEPGRMTRRGALPVTALTLLLDRGSVSMLDGAAHRQRKAMFMSLMAPEALGGMTEHVRREWTRRLPTWAAADRVVLLDEVRLVLCAAVCAWAGVSRRRDAGAAPGAAVHCHGRGSGLGRSPELARPAAPAADGALGAARRGRRPLRGPRSSGGYRG